MSRNGTIRALTMRGVSIQFPGGDKRYNPQSEPIAAEIVDLVADLGYDCIDFHQPQGGADIERVDGYTDLADRVMPPHLPGFGISWDAHASIGRARDRGMFKIGYSGCVWVRDDGTPDRRERRYFSRRDLPYFADGIHELASHSFDMIVLDDVNKAGSFLGMPEGTNWADPAADKIRKGEDPRTLLIREDYPYPKRWKTAVRDIYDAAVEGVGRLKRSITVGVEPDPRSSWVGSQLPALTPFMAVCELPQLANYPRNDAGRVAMLILNDHDAGYTLSQIDEYHWRCASMGYCSIVTWWVLKKALLAAGIDVPGTGGTVKGGVG